MTISSNGAEPKVVGQQEEAYDPRPSPGPIDLPAASDEQYAQLARVLRLDKRLLFGIQGQAAADQRLDAD